MKNKDIHSLLEDTGITLKDLLRGFVQAHPGYSDKEMIEEVRKKFDMSSDLIASVAIISVKKI